jgi:hypothetical protein
LKAEYSTPKSKISIVEFFEYTALLFLYTFDRFSVFFFRMEKVLGVGSNA